MAIDIDTMDQIMTSVFDEMLGMVKEPFSPDDEAFSQSRIVASIRISGTADELLVVEAPEQTAALIGATMFAADSDTLQEDDISDAVGEVVNMIGGNVKGTYAGDSELSLPCVGRETEPEAAATAGERLAVRVSGRPLLVRWQDIAPASAASCQ
jgi:chemotaxis protein CheX